MESGTQQWQVTAPCAYQFVKPRVIVSKCLTGCACRYNGRPIQDPPFTYKPASIEFVEVCPEVAIGLGIPRPEIKVVLLDGKRRLIQPATKKDLTYEMVAFGKEFFGKVSPVDGAIFKARSPSCGIHDTKVMESASFDISVAVGPGMFTETILSLAPRLLVIDEVQLREVHLRWHFYSVVFALARLRGMGLQPKLDQMRRFHADHKYYLMSFDQRETSRLGNLLANHAGRPEAEVISEYIEGIRNLLSRPPSLASLANAVMHVFGYVSAGLQPTEKSFFLSQVDLLRQGQVGLRDLVMPLRKWVEQQRVSYLSTQALLYPFPDELW